MNPEQNVSLPERFTYIALAERFNTTPWDVRKNMSLEDFIYISQITKARNAGQRVQQNKQKAAQKNASRSRRK